MSADIRELAVATDTKLADLYEANAKASRSLEAATDHLRRSAGQKSTYSHRGLRTWSGPLSEAIATAEVAHLVVPATYVERELIEALATVRRLTAEIEVNSNEISTLNRVWADHGGWSRFFIVRNNNGHIHSSMNCSTCFATTDFGWLPALSGLTEAEAVEAHGEILCSICFPSAPVEWTNGESKVSKEAKAARAAEKAAKAAAKLEKALMPDGKPLVLGNRWGESLGTVVAARNWLINALRGERWYGSNEERTEYIRIVSEALIAKTGSTEIIDKARKTASKDPS